MILPLTPARLLNKPTMGNHFLLMKLLASPTTVTVLVFIFLIIVPDGDKVVLAPLSYCGLETETTALELKFKNNFFLKE